MKLGNALIHILDRYPGFGRIQLIKTIFLADLVHYNLCKVLMFPSKYKKYPFGPVSSCAYGLTEPGQQYLDVKIEYFDDSNPYHKCKYYYKYKPKKIEDISIIPKYQLKILDIVAKFVQSKETADAISQFTHQLSIWNDTKDDTIAEEQFLMNEKDSIVLSTNTGIHLTRFAMEYGQFLYNNPMNISQIEENLSKLSSLFSSHHDEPEWNKWLDAYLAWDSAMMLCCKKRSSSRLNDLKKKGLDLITDIICSRADPQRVCDYERDFNQICEEVFQEKGIGIQLSKEAAASVNSVLRVFRQELGLDELDTK